MRTCRAACPRSLLRPRPAPGARLSGPRGQGRGVPPVPTAPAAGAESARPALPCPRAAALMRARPGAGDPAAQERVPTVPGAPDRGGRRHEGASRAHIRQRARGAAGAPGRAVLGPARPRLVAGSPPWGLVPPQPGARTRVGGRRCAATGMAQARMRAAPEQTARGAPAGRHPRLHLPRTPHARRAGRAGRAPARGLGSAMAGAGAAARRRPGWQGKAGRAGPERAGRVQGRVHPTSP